jgi:hypothetical protein
MNFIKKTKNKYIFLNSIKKCIANKKQIDYINFIHDKYAKSK